jgi:hypothetical protein
MEKSESITMRNLILIRISLLFIIIFMLLSLACCGGGESAGNTSITNISTSGSDKLLQSSDLVYQGAFRVPQGDYGSPQYHGLSYGGRALAFNAANNSLFMVGHIDDQLTIELAIPTPVMSASLSDFNTALVLQPFADTTGGFRDYVCADGAVSCATTYPGWNPDYIGGNLVYNGQLLSSVYNYYDGNAVATRSHYLSSLTLGSSFNGMFSVGNVPVQMPQIAFSAGYMGLIPYDYQSAMGGKVITGQGFLAITTRSSFGPAAFAFDPDNMTNTNNPVNATPLLYYNAKNGGADHSNETLGYWMSNNPGGTSLPYTSNSDFISGVVFPQGSKSVLFFGTHGQGASCYGAATANPSEAQWMTWLQANSPSGYSCGGTQMSSSEIAGGNSCCYDPSGVGNKGTHAYPYSHYVWAYNADDLVAAGSGTYTVTQADYNAGRFMTGTAPAISPLPVGSIVNPWNVYPYTSFNLDAYLNPFEAVGQINGAAYDPATQRIFISQGHGDSIYPLIHVFEVNLAASANVHTLAYAAGSNSTRASARIRP